MCGISGGIRYGGDEGGFRSACHYLHRSIALRGPDSDGIFISECSRIILTHRRLKILDLTAKADQPIHSACGRYTLVYNGEIYNFRELVRKFNLPDECLSSDTLTLLELISRHGIDSVEHLHGMFALVVYDKHNKNVSLIRDQLGIKPLYYALTRNVVYFCSYARPLGKLSKSQFSQEGLSQFYYLGFVTEPHTIYNDVKPCGAGEIHTFNLDSNQISKRKYFSLLRFYSNALGVVGNDYDIKDLFERVISAHCDADVDVGLLLSAGIDSTLVLSSMWKKRRVRAMHLVGREDEESKVRRLCALGDVDLYVRKSTFIDSEIGENYLESLDQPTVDGFNIYQACRLAKSQGIKVVLAGTGADEFLGGYRLYRHIGTLFRRDGQPSLVSKLLGLKPTLRLGSILQGRRNEKIIQLSEFTGSIDSLYLLSRLVRLPGTSTIEQEFGLSFDSVIATFKTEDPIYSALPPILRLSYLDSNIYLKNQLLRDADTASMANSIELRVPYLDLVLARAMIGITATAWEVRKRHFVKYFKSELPSEIRTGPKRGFFVQSTSSQSKGLDNRTNTIQIQNIVLARLQKWL